MAEDDQFTQEMDRIFKRFDTDGDGKISLVELAEVLESLGSTTPEEVKVVMSEIDTSGDGTIDCKEFMSFCRANAGLMKNIAKVF